MARNNGGMSPTRHDEVERKYDVEPETVVPDLAEPEGVASVRSPDEFMLKAVYFDTADLDLARRRITLRRRTGGADAGWHLKLPAGRDTRAELHAPLGPNAKAVPAPFLAQVRAIVRGRPLAPVASLATRRREYALCGADGAVLAVFCDDQCARLGGWRARLPRSTGGSGKSSSTAGRPSLLDAVESHLLAAGARPAKVSSKLARTIGVLPPAAFCLSPRRTRREARSGSCWSPS